MLGVFGIIDSIICRRIWMPDVAPWRCTATSMERGPWSVPHHGSQWWLRAAEGSAVPSEGLTYTSSYRRVGTVPLRGDNSHKVTLLIGPRLSHKCDG